MLTFSLRSAITIFVFAMFLYSSAASGLQNSFNKKPHDRQQVELLELSLIAGQIDKRVSTLQVIAKNLANDAHIHSWVDGGLLESGESILLDKLRYKVSEYSLTSASFADKRSNKYWNHEGFLRVLEPSIDIWYFDYVTTLNNDLISIYYDQNKKRVDLYVNHQQLPGNGLSGVATSFESVLATLDNSELSTRGTLFIVDKNADVKVHPKINFQQTSYDLPLEVKQALKRSLPSLKTSSSILTSNNTNILATPIGDFGWYLAFESKGVQN